ncbi:MAG: prepilin peptidase [Planctomycetes bacterium]|nr:prepilin peptidase [Planctomycetota bacterium]
MKEVFEIIKEMPPAFWLVMIFCIGAFVGSFLNVVVYRLPRNCLSINNPKRSFCPSCKTQLKWNDNLPIIGWLLLRGKCRYCGVKYGLRYPMVELLTAGLFTFAAWRVVYADGNLADQPMVWLTLLHAILIISVMLPWALIDFDLRMIPDKLTLGPLLVFIPFAADWRALDFGLASLRSTPDTAVAAEPGVHRITHLMFSFEPVWLNSMLSALAAGAIGYGALWLIGKGANILFAKRVEEMGGEAMGGGDIKLMLLMGVMLGWPKLLAAFFVAIFIGAVIGVYQIIARKGPGTPFGPYLAIGAILAALGSSWLVDLYNAYMGFLQGMA